MTLQRAKTLPRQRRQSHASTAPCRTKGKQTISPDSREDQDWKTRPALFTTASPGADADGVTADQVELRFSEEIADLYLGYDRVMPQPKLDYIFTETADGALQYQLDTVYNYEFIITTETGTDDFLVICEQE